MKKTNSNRINRKPSQAERTARAVPLVTKSACHLFIWLGLVGCQSVRDFEMPWNRTELPAPPKENWVLRAGHWEQEQPPPPGTLGGDFASAKILFDRGEYSDAASVFRKVGKRAEKSKAMDILEGCLFWEAECLYKQDKYRQAREVYTKLLNNFPSSRFRSQAVERQYAIADFWLEDTRQEMQAWKEKEDGKRWFVMPRLFNFDRRKPFYGTEAHAEKTCEAVYTQDPGGPLAPEALFKAGGVSYYRENFEDADDRFSVLVDQYPRSELAPKALELAIQSKVQVAGGPDYDGRKLAEARQLTDQALRTYPELKDKSEFLERTLLNINDQQAQKDYQIAEFYRRTKHPGSAYFYYELVRMRYPGTEWADKATDRMLELRDEVEKENARK